MSLACVTFAGAQDIDDFIQPVVTRQKYQQLCQRLRLAEQERFVLDVAYSDYASAIERLQGDAEQRATKVGLRELRAATDGRQAATLAQLAAWELAVLEECAKTWPAIDDLFAELCGDVQMIATGDSASRAPAAVRALRRELLLHSRKPDTTEERAYVGDGLDLLRMIEQAAQPGQELQGIVCIPGAGEDDAAPSAEVSRLLGEYELSLDALIQSSFAEHRAGRLARQRALIGKNAEALRQADQAAYGHWFNLYQLNRMTAERIAALLAASVSPAASQAWLNRVDQAVCPWLFDVEFPDCAAQWIAAQEQLPVEQRQKAAAAYEQFAARRREGRQRVLDLVIRSRSQLRALVHPTGVKLQIDSDPSRAAAVRAIDAAMHEIIALEAQTRTTLLNLLTDPQRVQMQRDLQDADRRKRGR